MSASSSLIGPQFVRQAGIGEDLSRGVDVFFMHQNPARQNAARRSPTPARYRWSEPIPAIAALLFGHVSAVNGKLHLPRHLAVPIVE
jgi:hypothetical protein